MGAIFSCLRRPQTNADHPSESTQISHPYPLTARHRVVMSESRPSSSMYHSIKYYQRPQRSSASASAPASVIGDQGTLCTPELVSRGRSARTRSVSAASASHRLSRPVRAHEIPFPLLSDHAACGTFDTAPGQIGTQCRQEDPTRGERGTPLPSPRAKAPADADRRRTLRKVRRVEKDWELWGVNDWRDYDVGVGERRRHVGSRPTG
jgi:hypothetical protein